MKQPSREEFNELAKVARVLTKNVLRAYSHPLGDIFHAFDDFIAWHSTIKNPLVRDYFKDSCIGHIYAINRIYTTMNIEFLGSMYSQYNLDLLALKN